MAGSSAFDRKFESIATLEEQQPPRRQNHVRTSILYALLFMLIIAGLTGLLFWATRDYLPPTTTTSTDKPTGLKQINIDTQALPNPDTFIHDLVQVHPARQLAMRLRDALKNNRKLAILIGLAVVALLVVVQLVRYWWRPAEEKLLTREERIALIEAQKWSLAYKAQVGLLTAATIAFVIASIYIGAYRSTSKSVRVRVTETAGGQKRESNKVNVDATGGTTFATYQAVLDHLKALQPSPSPHLNLFHAATELPITMTDKVQPYLVPEIIASPPLAIFRLQNFHIPLPSEDDASVLEDCNTLYIPVKSAGSKSTWQALLGTLNNPCIKPEWMRLVDAEIGDDGEIVFTKLTHKFNVTTEHRIKFDGELGVDDDHLRVINVPAHVPVPGCTTAIYAKLPASITDKISAICKDNVEFYEDRMTGADILANLSSPAPPLADGEVWHIVLRDGTTRLFDLSKRHHLKYQLLTLRAIPVV